MKTTDERETKQKKQKNEKRKEQRGDASCSERVRDK